MQNIPITVRNLITVPRTGADLDEFETLEIIETLPIIQDKLGKELAEIEIKDFSIDDVVDHLNFELPIIEKFKTDGTIYPVEFPASFTELPEINKQTHRIEVFSSNDQDMLSFSTFSNKTNKLDGRNQQVTTVDGATIVIMRDFTNGKFMDYYYWQCRDDKLEFYTELKFIDTGHHCYRIKSYNLINNIYVSVYKTKNIFLVIEIECPLRYVTVNKNNIKYICSYTNSNKFILAAIEYFLEAIMYEYIYNIIESKISIIICHRVVVPNQIFALPMDPESRNHFNVAPEYLMKMYNVIIWPDGVDQMIFTKGGNGIKYIKTILPDGYSYEIVAGQEISVELEEKILKEQENKLPEYCCPCCLTQNVSYIAIPCHHTLCEACAGKVSRDSLEQGTELKCIKCRTTVEHYSKFYV